MKTNSIDELTRDASATIDLLVMPKLPGIHNLDAIWICDFSGKSLIKDPKIGPFKVDFQ